MTESCEPDSWEDLEQLTLNPAPSTTSQKPKKSEETAGKKDEAPESKAETPRGDSIDQALKEALKNPRERANVLRIDADVYKFILDKTRCTIEFSYDLTSYQRLLAHRVSQMYGLQTSSVPLGNGLSRVIAHKTQETKPPPVRVIEVKDVYCPPESAKKAAPPEVTIKRRQGGTSGQVGTDVNNGSMQATNSGNNRSVKQREEEYKAARDRILGDESHADGLALPRMSDDADDDGKVRKAVFRDRVKELQDPDYRRGSTNRYQSSPYESQFNDGNGYGEAKINTTGGVYSAPTYNSEFPALPGATGPVLQPPYPPTAQPVYVTPDHQLVGKQGYGTQLNYTMPNSVMHPGLSAQFPMPMGAYGFSPGARPSGFRMVTGPMVVGPTNVTQPMMSGWNQPGFPTVQTAAVPATTAAVRPQQSFGVYAVPPYQNYAALPPGAVRSPYIAVAQGNNHLQHSAPVDPSAGHMHQMMTIRRKPVSSAQNEGSTQSDR